MTTDSPHIAWPDYGISFATTPAAYREFVQAARLRPLVATQIRRLRAGADIVAVGASIRSAFAAAEVPPGLVESIEDACRKLGGSRDDLTVTSAATDEPLDEFLTGPQELFSQVSGMPSLLAACKRCWACLFTDRAIIYREVRGIDHLSVDLAVHVQCMVTADRTPRPSGVLVASGAP